MPSSSTALIAEISQTLEKVKLQLESLRSLEMMEEDRTRLSRKEKEKLRFEDDNHGVYTPLEEDAQHGHWTPEEDDALYTPAESMNGLNPCSAPANGYYDSYKMSYAAATQLKEEWPSLPIEWSANISGSGRIVVKDRYYAPDCQQLQQLVNWFNRKDTSSIFKYQRKPKSIYLTRKELATLQPIHTEEAQ
jgi:hypothetical protein